MNIKDIQIGQGYLLVETTEKLGAFDFARNLVDITGRGIKPRRGVSKDYNNNTKDSKDGLTLRQKIGLDKMHDLFIKIPLNISLEGGLIIPGLSKYQLAKHKIFYVNKDGNNKFNDPEWNVLSKAKYNKLPFALKQVYSSLKKFN